MIKQRLKAHKSIIENFSYITLFQFFVLLSPLITYPYLIRVLGKDLYGLVITAQVLVGYFSTVIDFGSNSISARYIAINSHDIDKMSSVMSSILSCRFYLWIFCFIVYAILVFCVSAWRDHCFMFLFTFGFTLNELLFPQFFFQGIERMKNITVISLVIRSLFIAMVFFFISQPSDYIFVPFFYTIGALVGGTLSLGIVIKKYGILLSLKKWNDIKPYVKDCSPILATDLVCTIKDKFNYFLIGRFIGIGDVVVYDLGIKLISVLVKPVNILCTVLMPQFSKNPNKRRIIDVVILSIIASGILSLLCFLFLDQISLFFLKETKNLLPIQIFLIVPIILSASMCIAYNFIIAKGMNRCMLWSIIISTIAYCATLAVIFLLKFQHYIISFVIASVVAYVSELIYRSFVLLNNE